MKFFKSNDMDNKKLVLMGVLNSLGTVLYIIIVVTFLSNAKNIFGEGDNSFFIPVIMLTLFVMSALITGGLVLGKPVMLYFDGWKKEAVKLLVYTAISLLTLFVLVVLAYLGLK